MTPNPIDRDIEQNIHIPRLDKSPRVTILEAGDSGATSIASMPQIEIEALKGCDERVIRHGTDTSLTCCHDHSFCVSIVWRSMSLGCGFSLPLGLLHMPFGFVFVICADMLKREPSPFAGQSVSKRQVPSSCLSPSMLIVFVRPIIAMETRMSSDVPAFWRSAGDALTKQLERSGRSVSIQLHHDVPQRSSDPIAQTQPRIIALQSHSHESA